jgi:hypothetical protein
LQLLNPTFTIRRGHITRLFFLNLYEATILFIQPSRKQNWLVLKNRVLIHFFRAQWSLYRTM